MAWKLCRGRSRVWAVITLAFSLGGIWTVLALAHHAPDQGILAFLFEIFLTFAALYWFDFRRISTGVLTSILGLVAWASVFPVGLLCDYLIPAAQIPPELWNVPKYFVAFGMILTLLEDEFLAAGRAMEHYRLLFAANPHPMWVQDPETLRILEVNDAAVAHYGYSREEFVSMTLRDLRPTEDAARFSKKIPDQPYPALRPLAPPPERRLLHPGGYGVPSHRLHGADVQLRPGAGRHRSPADCMSSWFTRRITTLLTGLPNRLLLEDRMQQSLAQAARHGQQAAVLCLDLDRFKQINDSFGHAAGDLCLQQVVARISARLRAVDTFARTGGDEFVIILGELANKNSALMVARSVLESISKPIEVEDFSFDISASIGIAIYPDDGTDSVATAALGRCRDVSRQAGGRRPISSGLFADQSLGQRGQRAGAIHAQRAQGWRAGALLPAAILHGRQSLRPAKRFCGSTIPNWARSRRTASCPLPRSAA